MPIIGKIAQILDSTQVVLNVGTREGVMPGMRFVIYEEGSEIVDPDSGDALGVLELVKGQVTAEHVQERLTLARTPAVKREGTPSSVLSARMAEISRAQASEAQHIELYVQRSQLAGAPRVKPVQVGDWVRHLPASDAAEPQRSESGAADVQQDDAPSAS